jgi:two-component system OmpR family sensor kinase
MTRRLIAWLTALTVVLWIGASTLGALVMRREFDEVFDSALSETAQRLLPLVVDDIFRDGAAGPRRLAQSPGSNDEEYLTFQIRDANGAVLMHSHDAPAEPFEAPLTPGFHDAAAHRVFTVAAVSGTIVLQVADPLAHRAEAMREGLLALLLPILALIPLAVLGVWLVVRRALRPVSLLSAEIGSRSGTNLARLDPGPLPPELTAIAHSVDDLLDRLRRTIEAERSFSANAAHELRTPLAGALAQTQRLVEEAAPGPVRDRARTIERSLHGLSQISEKLLQLARAEAGIGRAVKPVPLEPVVRMVAEDFRRTAHGEGRFVVDVRAPLAAAVDVDAFAIVMRNLIENALVHGPPDQPVRVAVSGDRIDVSNGGRAVAPDMLVRLVQPFERGGARAKGAGLGLAIADTLARQMGARLDLSSPVPGRADGFQASLVFGPTE